LRTNFCARQRLVRLGKRHNRGSEDSSNSDSFDERFHGDTSEDCFVRRYKQCCLQPVTTV
jgi:hypothetical protein